MASARHEPTGGHMATSAGRAATSAGGAAAAAKMERAPTGHTGTQRPAPGDSILSMDILIERFQADLPRATSLGDDAPRSRDELIARFAAAVADSSTEGLQAITLNAAEFAYLYFPTSLYARPPYAQPPAVNWLLLEQNSLKGRARLLRHYGGKRLVVEGHECAVEPDIQGRNRIHEQCTLNIRQSDGGLHAVRLFGSIIERDDRFKLMSLANRL